MIPTEWRVRRLGELGKIVRGGSPRPAGDPRYFGGHFIPWLTVAALTNIPEHQLLVTETASGLTEEGSKRSRTLSDGTVIIANSGATLGVAKLLGVTCCANDGIAAIADQREGDRAFVCHYINTRTQHLREVIATGNGQPNLNTALIREIPIPFPPLQEQRAVSATLSDVNALLTALDRLIAKKRDLKQAAMQQLLTGQTRLPGFQGEWESTTFGQIAQPRRDRVDPRSTGVQDFCVELEHIASTGGGLLGHTSAGAQASMKSVFSAGDVLFGKLRAYLRKYWLATRPGVCSTEIWVLAPKGQTITTEFLFQLVKTDDFIKTASNAYGTHMPRSDWSIVKNFEFALPPVPEQRAIAAVLTDMDAELAALEARRDKTRALKHGMMQELLTGRTRLV
ncbi:MAG: restriction endonuclease subunit S [Gemmatimonadetes bacterium]|nr:restriction endonuclease subunit S [Gemmatimonadota bacterium]